MKRARAKMEARKGRVKELMSGRLRHPSSGAASFKQFRLRKRAAANRPRRAALATERRAQPYHRVRVRQFACSVRSNPSITNLEIDTQTVKFEQSFLQKTRSPQNEWGYAIAVQRLAASHLFVRRHAGAEARIIFVFYRYFLLRRQHGRLNRLCSSLASGLLFHSLGPWRERWRRTEPASIKLMSTWRLRRLQSSRAQKRERHSLSKHFRRQVLQASSGKNHPCSFRRRCSYVRNHHSCWCRS